MRLLRESFARWVDAQDPDAAIAAASPRAWAGIVVFLGCLLVVTGYLPVASDFFELRVGPAAAAFIPAAVAVSLFHVFYRSEGLKTRAWLAYLCGNSGTQFFCAALVAFGSTRAAPVFSLLFLITAAYHAHLHRVTPSEPFLAMGTALAASSAYLLSPTDEHRVILLFVGATAVMLSFLTGTYAANAQLSRRESERLRQAVQAQILHDQGAEVSRLRASMLDVLAVAHDVNNAITALSLEAEILVEQVPQGFPVLTDTLSSMGYSLRNVRRLLESVRRPGDKSLLSGEQGVDVMVTVEQARKAVLARFPSVSVACALEAPTSPSVQLSGGDTSLRRIVENLLLNSCEGDGRKAAGRITCTVVHDPESAAVRLLVEDDGPGFSPELLSRGIQGFQTTKLHGTGLGLYTVERLVLASGGSVRLSTAPGGGALVEVVLPRAHAPSVPVQAASGG